MNSEHLNKKRGFAVSSRVSICLGIFLMALSSAWAGRAYSAADDPQVVKDFEARVSSYLDLSKKQAPAPKPTDSPSKLAETHDQIAEKMRAARPDAKQGDIFTPKIAAYFRHQIAATLAGHDGRKVRASLRHAEPVQNVPLQVNARYPQKLPLQSTPPTLLLNLPHLPRELQYRIVGRALLLYDAQADLIVDFVPEAVLSN